MLAMSIRILMTLVFFVVLGGMRAVWAQQPVTKPTPGPLVRPVGTADRPTWDDPNRHIRIVASYDGRRVKVLKAVTGEGSARSYLSQRRDIVVVILNEANQVLREFNLPDPLELRVRERQPAAQPSVSEPQLAPPGDSTESTESILRQRQTQFELFVPRLEGAKWLEFRKGDAKGRRLGRVDLTKVQ
jgi:hypothetical protein